MVVFIADDLGYADSETAGNRDVRTPNMLRLAADGMTCTRAYAASPSCAPSRAAFLTGLMPARNGSMRNHQPPREDVRKLPGYLHELGYEVVAFGKVAHYEQAKLYGFDLASHDTFHDDECVAAALEFLAKRTSTRPLCLLVGTNWPHVPWPDAATGTTGEAYELPPRQVDTPETREWRARYYAAVETMDAELGKVYEASYHTLGSNTLFVHFSDHGAQWPFGKWNLYEAGVRVPLLATWPGVIAPKSRTDAVISLVDLLPTLIEAAGGEPPGDIDGRSRLALLRGEGGRATETFATHSGDGRMNEYPMRSVVDGNWKYIRNIDPSGEHHTHIDRGKPVDGSAYWASWTAKARTDKQAQALVARYYVRPAEELYNLPADPHELVNLAADPAYAEVKERLGRALDDWMQRQGDLGLATERAVRESFPPK
jgi:arylsulfatase A-like enzyme